VSGHHRYVPSLTDLSLRQNNSTEVRDVILKNVYTNWSVLSKVNGKYIQWPIGRGAYFVVHTFETVVNTICDVMFTSALVS